MSPQIFISHLLFNLVFVDSYCTKRSCTTFDRDASVPWCSAQRNVCFRIGKIGPGYLFSFVFSMLQLTYVSWEDKIIILFKETICFLFFQSLVYVTETNIFYRFPYLLSIILSELSFFVHRTQVILVADF